MKFNYFRFIDGRKDAVNVTTAITLFSFDISLYIGHYVDNVEYVRTIHNDDNGILIIKNVQFYEYYARE